MARGLGCTRRGAAHSRLSSDVDRPLGRIRMPRGIVTLRTVKLVASPHGGSQPAYLPKAPAHGDPAVCHLVVASGIARDLVLRDAVTTRVLFAMLTSEFG